MSTLPYSNQDVLFGRGRIITNHHGNVTLRACIKDRLNEYNNALTTTLKREIQIAVYTNIHRQNGKFRKKEPNTNNWVIVPQQEALTKIAMAFHTLNSEAKKEAASAMVSISIQPKDNPSDDKTKAAYNLLQFRGSATPDTLSNHLSIDDTSFSRRLYFDDELWCAKSWLELKSRLLPSKYIYHILSIYAFHTYGIYKLEHVRSRSNSKKRIYKCATCQSNNTWQVMVRKISNLSRDCLWQVQENQMANNFVNTNNYVSLDTTLLPCVCNDTTKRTISEQLFFNITWVRDIVSNNPSRSAAEIEVEIINKFATEKIHISCLPARQGRRNAIAQLRCIYICKMPHLYCQLPQYLTKLSVDNPLSSVALQSDQYNQFYRLFVGLPIAHQHGKLTLPILMVDCFHYQCPSYDGIAIALTSKTGFGLSVVYAFAIIPTEDTNNISWFLQLCVLHGIDFDCALFTDQGPLLSAANAISVRLKVKFNLMLCVQHLLRNVKHKFPQFKEQTLKNILSNLVNDASSARTIDDFFHVLDQMVHSFVCISVPVQKIVDMTYYLLRIDPCHWTVFANTPSFDKHKYDITRKSLLAQIGSAGCLSENFDPKVHKTVDTITSLLHDCNDYGTESAESAKTKHIYPNNKRCPRFCHQRTNVAESIANLFLSNGFRHEIPPLSIPSFLSAYNKMVLTAINELEKCKHMNLSTIGHTLAKCVTNTNMDEDIKCEQIELTIYNGGINMECRHDPSFIDDQEASIVSHMCEEKTNTPCSHNQYENRESEIHLHRSVTVNSDSLPSDEPSPIKSPMLTDSSVLAPPVQKFGSTFIQPSFGTPVSRKEPARKLEVQRKRKLSPHRQDDQQPLEQLRKKKINSAGKQVKNSLKHVKNAFDSFLDPLSDKEKNIYNETFENRRDLEHVGGYGGIRIIYKDLKTLRPGTWLNDTIIDLFYSLLDRREEILNKNKQLPQCLFMRTAFMTTLYLKEDKVNEYSYSNVRSWTNRVDIFEFDKIFIPVHVTDHWFCMAIFMNEQTIEVLDSLKGGYGKLLEVVFKYLSDEHQHRKGKPLPGKWKLYHRSDKNILCQTNGFDCGVYTCMNADRLSLIDKAEFKNDDSTTIYRQRMALQIERHNIPPKPKVTRTSRKVPTIIDLTVDNPTLIITMTDGRRRYEDLELVDHSSSLRIKLICSQLKYREVEATTDYSPNDTYLMTEVTVKSESLPKKGEPMEVVIIEDENNKAKGKGEDVSNGSSNDSTFSNSGSGVLGKRDKPTGVGASAANGPTVDLLFNNTCSPSTDSNVSVTGGNIMSQATVPTFTCPSLLSHEAMDDDIEGNISIPKTNLVKKTVVLKGLFSQGLGGGTHTAKLILQFDGNCQIIGVQNICQHHENHTSMVLSPCSCIGDLLEYGKKKVPDFPITSTDQLYPDCLQSKKNYEHLNTESKNGYILNYHVDIPNLRAMSTEKTNLEVTLADGTPVEKLDESEFLEAAPKYKNILNGRRIRSNGETKSSARLHMNPRHNREGSITTRLTEDGKKVRRMKPSKAWIEAMSTPGGLRYKVSSVNQWSEVNYGFVDSKANGCVFRRGDYSCVMQAGKEDNHHVGVLVKSNKGPLLCIFNYVQFTESGNTYISTAQIQDGNVQVDLEGLKLVIGEYTIDLCIHNDNPCLKMSTPAVEQFHSFPHVNMTSSDEPWDPFRISKKRFCSICRDPFCRGPRCLKLHSFGKGTTLIKDLRPGKYWVFHTQKTMLEAFEEDCKRPIDLFPKNQKSKYTNDVNDLLPLQSPPNQSDNIANNHETSRRKALMKQAKVHQEERDKCVNHLATSNKPKLSDGSCITDKVNELNPSLTKASKNILERIMEHGKGDRKEEDFIEKYNQLDYLSSIRQQADMKANYDISTARWGVFECNESITTLQRIIIERHGPMYINLIKKITESPILSQSLTFDSDSDDEFYNGCLASQEYDNNTFCVNKILGHRGPLQPGDESYHGSRYNVKVLWSNPDKRDETEEPLSEMVKQIPSVMAEYAIKNRLTNENGWRMPKLQSFIKLHLRQMETEHTTNQMIVEEGVQEIDDSCVDSNYARTSNKKRNHTKRMSPRTKKKKTKTRGEVSRKKINKLPNQRKKNRK